MVRLLVIVGVLSLVPSMAGAQDAQLEDELRETQDEREAVIEDLEDTRSRESGARERLAELDAQLDRAEAALAELQVALEAAEEVRDAAVADADEARTRLREVRSELSLVEAEYAAQQDQLHDRIRSAYMYGQVSFADALTGTHELTDFLNTTTYVSHVLDGDRQLVDQVNTLLSDVQRRRAEAQALRVEAEAYAAEAASATESAERAAAAQAAATEDVRRQREERAAALEQLRTDRAAMEGHLAGLEAESAQIESQLADIARQQEEERRRAEAAAQQSQVGPGPGGWARPASGRLTSAFGPRWGRNHNGVDLSGSMGSAVVAAADGTVVSVVTGCHPTSSWGCGGGFGNYVTIAHAGGMATISAHLSSIGVAPGQAVASGQTVGQIGNSGNSYGPHLHFETRQAGVPQNPCGFINC